MPMTHLLADITVTGALGVSLTEERGKAQDRLDWKGDAATGDPGAPALSGGTLISHAGLHFLELEVSAI